MKLSAISVHPAPVAASHRRRSAGRALPGARTAPRSIEEPSDIRFRVHGCNPHVVRGLAVQAAASVPRVIEDPAPVCQLTGFGPQSTLDFILRFWIDDPVEGVTNIRGLVLLALWDVLTRAGIEIPHYVGDMRMREPVRVIMQPHDKQPGDADEQGRDAPTGPT